MRRTLLPLALVAGLTVSVPALAQMAPPVLDTVSLTLSAEDWVKSETALVTLVVDAAGNGTDAGTLRGDLVKVAGAVADKADWRIVRLDRVPDQAGLDRWQAGLQARLPEAQLSNLAERTKKASRPGLQVRVGAVAFDPTLAEMEAAKGALRDQLYRRVNEELAKLKTAFPDRDFRVGGVDFMEYEPPQPVPAPMMRATAVESFAKADAVQGGVQEKLRITARVTLSAFAKAPAP
ncbi:hypothetical protein [Oleisolibacter albus]|uniref:hypothetical protein n=1 Tax=Oleisolibacter albus TaxID=2171757 RepID=UPI000DF44650|nr:hypothetical protein [Oleisolibacter albus]